MDPKMSDQNRQVVDEGPLGQLLSTELGEPAPIDQYHRPLEQSDRSRLESELKAVEDAQAEAASQLPNLYAG
jgi:hypothetical protein